MNPAPVFNADGLATQTGVIQGLDPRLRLVAAAVFAVATVSLRDLGPLAGMVGLALLLALAARLPARATVKRLAAMDAFMAVVLITLPFTIEGTEMLRVGPLVASVEGSTRAVAIVLKANAVILAVLALAGTIESVTAGHALAGLGCPKRLVHLMLFTVRYAGILRDEFARHRDAMRVRAFKPRFNRHTWRSLGWLVGMLLVRSLQRARRIQNAMKCRGFRGTLPLMRRFALGGADWRFAAALSAALVGVFAWEIAA